VQPELRYAKSGDLSIAYQVIGDGPIDLVVSQGWVSNVGLIWDNPVLARFYGRLAEFSRLILFDKRGTGLSDRPGKMPTLEERMDDLRAVLDYAGSEDTSVFGLSEGGSMSLLFAATYPERTCKLVLFGPFARRAPADDYPWAPSAEARQRFYDAIQNRWHEDMDLHEIAPSIANDPQQVKFWANYMRMSASPSAALELAKMNTEIDVRNVLSSIRVPTLLLHRTGDRDANVEEGRWIASQIPNAIFKELPGSDHLPFVGDWETVVDNVEQFVTGSSERHVADRVLATILFADIVGSTRIAAEYGDRRWRNIVESYQGLMERTISRHRGRLVKFTGDGVLAIFDGPGRALACARELVEGMQGLGFSLRVGVHSGEVEMIGDDIGGIAVHIASRIADLSGPNEVLASRTVRDLTAGSGHTFVNREEHQLAGISEPWQLFSVTG
jgi:class 3 adenylate cyclase/pimeloyl-ACP methyl ester carboxylesterase